MFRFNESYVNGEDRPVLGLQFEENIRKPYKGFRSFPVWFRNVMPEGRFRSLLCQSHDIVIKGVEEIDVDTQLLNIIGEDLPGAISFTRIEPEWGLEDDQNDKEEQGQRDSLRGEADLLRFSAAGVGIKFSVDERDGQFVLPAKSESGHWYIKMPHPRLRNLPSNEYATMLLAGRVGINVPKFKLVGRDAVMPVDDVYWGSEDQAFAIKRFDRTPTGKVHIEDFAQVRGYKPEDKYRGTYESVASFAYRGGDSASLVEFVKRLAFSVAIGNSDAHLKNWSLIYEDRKKPKLSPAYDLVSIAAYRADGIDQNLALSWSNDQESTRFDLVNFSRLEARLSYGGESLRAIAEAVWAATYEQLSADESIYSYDPVLRSLLLSRVSVILKFAGL